MGKKTRCKERTTRFGFTLAEVLVTLSVIGVVAALTIPSLVKDYQEHVYRQQWRKTFSSFAQATKILEANGNTACIPTCDADGNNCDTPATCQTFNQYTGIRDAYATVLKCAKVGTNVQTIFSNHYNNYKSTTGAAFTIGSGNIGTLILADGTSVYFYAPAGETVLVDVNGPKPPNELGKDFFVLNIKNINGTYITEPVKEMYGHTECHGGDDQWLESAHCSAKALSFDPMP